MEDAAGGTAGDLLIRGLTIPEIAALTGGQTAVDGDMAARVVRVEAMHQATAEGAVFARDAALLRAALQTGAGAILASRELQAAVPEAAGDGRVVWVRDARTSFAQVAQRLRPRLEQSEISPSAEIDGTAVLGARVRIGPGVVIGAGVVLGDDSVLDARVVVYAGTRLGQRVEVQAGAVLGSAGFGYVREPETGRYVLFPQQGCLVIEDDVSIGANVTIDRGALGETRIGRGTKIDNLVHIAHNCVIGEDVVIAAQTGIAGSSRIGDGAVIAGQVGIADHVEIGPGVVLGAKAGVPSRKRIHGAGEVFWGIPARPIGQYLRELAKLRRGLHGREG